MPCYAGIGSRETPQPVLDRMERIGKILAKAGWVLRSGAAPGADSAFERGCVQAEGQREIFIPWDGFQDRRSLVESGVYLVPMLRHREAEEIAARNHKGWNWLKQGARKLHIRNVCQVLGFDLQTPVELVICWTAGGSGQGGTGQALRIAAEQEIPIFDLGAEGSWEALCARLPMLKVA